MQVKDTFLKKISCTFLICIFLISKSSFAKDTIIEKVIEYNESLNNSSVLFIQSDGGLIKEGVIYIGFERIKVNYDSPRKITIVLSKKKGMYVDHELRETQFFNTKKNFVRIFYELMLGGDFYKESNTKTLNDIIKINNTFDVNETLYKTEIIYENNPIKLRKIIIYENEVGLELGFFGHNNLEVFEKKKLLLIDPYLN